MKNKDIHSDNSSAKKLTRDDEADSYSSGHESSDSEDYLDDSDKMDDDSEGNVTENEDDSENESEVEFNSDSSEEEDEGDVSIDKENEDDHSLDEEEIEAAEKAYLQELRAQQDAIGKQQVFVSTYFNLINYSYLMVKIMRWWYKLNFFLIITTYVSYSYILFSLFKAE